MTIPVCTAVCEGLHEKSYPSASLPKTITLTGSATEGPILEWEWSVVPTDPSVRGGYPAGSAVATGVNGDFTAGKATIQSPSCVLDLVGGYCFTLRARNASGWSRPSYPYGDGTSCQAIVFMMNTAGQKYPPEQMFRYADVLNALIAEAALAVRTITPALPLSGGGSLAADRVLGINQATSTTDGYLTQGDWAAFTAKMTNVMSALGDLIVGGTAGAPGRLPVGASGTVLHGGTPPGYSKVVEGDLSLSAITTANATHDQHGFMPALSNNGGQYLNGQGNWGTPAGVTSAYTSLAFLNETSVTVTHNFGAYPLVQVLNGAGLLITPQSITHTDLNNTVITFTGSTSGTLVLSLGSPQAQAVRVVAANYPVTAADRIVQGTATGKTITLLTAVGNTGREFIVDNGSAGNIFLEPQAGQTIEDEAIQTIPPNSAIHVYADGAGWRIY